MDLIEVIQSITQGVMKASDLTDLSIGTVSKVSPLQITEENVSDPIPAQALLLTASVVEKKIAAPRHTHSIAKSYPGWDTLEAAIEDALVDTQCYEAGKALTNEPGYITLNQGLAVGDRVLMLRVSGGQRYIILSRIFEGG
ncbi:DUF2577 family protein [Oscillibacter sp.]|uniref:DUF2577 family protein n=1 Tax=Oscillibacter sp. TaxID=1945593 RepID=UPI00289F963B|nr:DUF2577 family protein [Oscillibacter sp.]